MENVLKNLHGVLEVNVRLLHTKLGEAEVLYDPAKVALKELEQVIPGASGSRHRFAVSALTDKEQEKLKGGL